jgi:hypothetical protein
MSAHVRALRAAVRRTLTPSFQANTSVLAVVSALLAGCSSPLPPLSGPDPSDPAAPTPRVSDHSTIAPYRSQRPVEPAPWGEQNQRVAPQPKSSQ